MKKITKNRIIGYSCALFATLFWGIHAVIIRYLASGGVNPYLIAGYRLYCAIIVLLIFFIVKKIFFNTYSSPKIKYNRFFFISSICLALNLILFHYGMKYTIASNAKLIENFSPVIVFLMAMFFLPKKIYYKYFKSVLWVVLIGSIGASLILVNDLKNIAIDYFIKLKGDTLEIMAMLFWAFFILASNEYMSKEKSQSSIKITLNTLIICAIIITPFIPFSQFFTLNTKELILLTIIGVFSTGLSYLLWHHAQKYLDVVQSALLLNFTGVITILFESLVFGVGEFITWKLLLGAALMIYASYSAEIINKKAEADNKQE